MNAPMHYSMAKVNPDFISSKKYSLFFKMFFVNFSDKNALSARKRSVEFMGVRVSYPQYFRLISIQKEVIRMDQTIRSMLQSHDPKILARDLCIKNWKI